MHPILACDRSREAGAQSNFANELGVDCCTASREADQMDGYPGWYLCFVTYLARNKQDTTIFRRA